MVALRTMAVKRRYVPLNNARTAAAQKDFLGDAATGGALGLADAEGSALVGTTTNGGATASATDKALFLIPLPEDYAVGGAIKLGVRCGVSVARTAAATIDAIVKLIGDGALGADICATNAIACNHTTWQDKLFSLTITGLTGGILNCELQMFTNDTGGSGNGAGRISAVFLEYDAYV